MWSCHVYQGLFTLLLFSFDSSFFLCFFLFRFFFSFFCFVFFLFCVFLCCGVLLCVVSVAVMWCCVVVCLVCVVVLLCVVVCHAEKHPCVHSKRLRVYVQNVTVCTRTTRTCGNTCARGGGTHGDVLNVHTQAF